MLYVNYYLHTAVTKSVQGKHGGPCVEGGTASEWSAFVWPADLHQRCGVSHEQAAAHLQAGNDRGRSQSGEEVEVLWLRGPETDLNATA